MALVLAADLAGLAGLAADLLAGVAHALALVGLRLACRPDAGRDLADELLVDADDREVRRILELEADSWRRIDLDLMAVAEVELELLADERRAIAHAVDLEALAVARRDPDDHVVHERPGEPMELLVHLLLARARDDDLVGLALDEHLGMELPRQGALGSLDRDVPAVDRDIDPGGNGDGHAADSGHLDLPDVRQDFAAELGLAGLRAGHDPVARADDDDGQAAEDPGDVGLAGVDPEARLPDALETGLGPVPA